MQSVGMETNWAAENLQTIRTLMERSTLYRRTLAPILLFTGAVGCGAAAAGILLRIESFRAFVGFWLGTAGFVVAGAFLIARRQALKDHEPFWSSPTRRVANAILLPLTAGLLFSIVLLVLNPSEARWLFIFPNALLYGCALHAAGFFMLRGVRLFAWVIILASASTLLIAPWVRTDPAVRLDHILMGGIFGGLHVLYSAYLFLTEKRGNES